MLKIEFHGAAKTVTGSNFVVRSDYGNFVVDCGMFQGMDVEQRNLLDFDYDPSEIDFALLTHAHIDHSGMLPKLHKHGFRGNIYATHNTVHITEYLLQDSAKIQENNFRQGLSFGKHVKDVTLVYNAMDAEDTISLFKSVNYNEEFEPMEGFKVRFIHSGHILGAASIEVDIKDGDTWKTILFSGDIGRLNSPLIETYDVNYRSAPDYILIESLYGGKYHPDRNDSVQDMYNIINETIDRGGNIFIPSFSVQRTQEILLDLKKGREKGQISTDVPVYLDSPLAQRVTKIYLDAVSGDPEKDFVFEGLMFIKKYKDSQKLGSRKGQIIIAGSGMADGGRIMDHFSRGLNNPKNSAVFVGYQAEGTVGREIVDGASAVNIGKSKVEVKASIHHLTGFSAHGDTIDYNNFLKRHNTNKLKKVFLIHADEERAKGLDDHMEEIGIGDDRTYIPDWKESVDL